MYIVNIAYFFPCSSSVLTNSFYLNPQFYFASSSLPYLTWSKHTATWCWAAARLHHSRYSQLIGCYLLWLCCIQPKATAVRGKERGEEEAQHNTHSESFWSQPLLLMHTFPSSLFSKMQLHRSVRKIKLLEHTGGTLMSNIFSNITANPLLFSLEDLTPLLTSFPVCSILAVSFYLISCSLAEQHQAINMKHTQHSEKYYRSLSCSLCC